MKSSNPPGQTRSLLIAFISAICFVVFISSALNSFNPIHVTSHLSTEPLSSRRTCPIIVYNKQIKTGSTVIANVLYRTTEAYGCYNAGCKLHQLLMNGNASHIGARNGLTLTCHAQEKNELIVPHLRSTHAKEFAYIASVREPIGWFKSAACFFYRQRVDAVKHWSDDVFKKVIDWMLQPEIIEGYESYLFLSLGLQPNAPRRDIMDKLLQYDLIIDHAEMDEGLKELGTLLDWKLLEPTQSKATTYRGPLYDTYRADEIKKATSRLLNLYEAASEIREARHTRPAFAVDEAPKIEER